MTRRPIRAATRQRTDFPPKTAQSASFGGGCGPWRLNRLRLHGFRWSSIGEGVTLCDWNILCFPWACRSSACLGVGAHADAHVRGALALSPALWFLLLLLWVLLWVLFASSIRVLLEEE